MTNQISRYRSIKRLCMGIQEAVPISDLLPGTVLPMEIIAEEQSRSQITIGEISAWQSIDTSDNDEPHRKLLHESAERAIEPTTPTILMGIRDKSAEALNPNAREKQTLEIFMKVPGGPVHNG